jgi:hypothetical protein
MRPVPRIAPFDRPATYADLEAVPDIMVAEIVDDELHASPRPALPHSHVASAFGALIGGPFHYSRGGPGGWWILFEPELHFGRNVLVPDLVGWRRSRLPKAPAGAYCSVAPDWICEILSPSTAQLDRAKKLRVYAREQVGHAWLVDPSARTLEVLQLHEGRWVILGVHVDHDVVRAAPFTEVELELALLWPED